MTWHTWEFGFVFAFGLVAIVALIIYLSITDAPGSDYQ